MTKLPPIENWPFAVRLLTKAEPVTDNAAAVTWLLAVILFTNAVLKKELFATR